MLSTLYGAVTRARRRYFAADPARRRRLSRPVISIGNVAVGGRGKTPLVATVAALLRDNGEVPAILSRGYGRRHPEDGIVVVRDPQGIRADLARAGDEPLMLAKQLEGTAVLSCADRYLAGRLAESHFGCTVHVLDDGFQHLQLERDIDIVAVANADLDDPRTLPTGRLREPLDALAAADAVVAVDGTPLRAFPSGGQSAHWGDAPVFVARRVLGAAMGIGAPSATVDPGRGPVVAVAGIAHPDRFFADLRDAGWSIVRSLPYSDHHPYSPPDLQRMMRVARDARVELLVTTEKDAMRLLPYRPFRIPIAYVPLGIAVEPAGDFEAWLLDGVRAARRRLP